MFFSWSPLPAISNRMLMRDYTTVGFWILFIKHSVRLLNEALLINTYTLIMHKTSDFISLYTGDA